MITNIDQIIGQSIFEKILCLDNREEFNLFGIKTTNKNFLFVECDQSKNIIRFHEKNAVTNIGICGIYYFKKHEYFFNNAIEYLEHSKLTKNVHYVSDCLNQCLLNGLRGNVQVVNRSNYNKFFTHNDIKDYENVKHK